MVKMALKKQLNREEYKQHLLYIGAYEEQELDKIPRKIKNGEEQEELEKWIQK